MKKEISQLKNNTISLMIIQFLNYVLPFVTLPYVARIFEVEKFGLIFYAQVLIDYFFRFVMFGFDISGTRTVAICSDEPEKVNSAFNSIICTQMFLLAIAFVLLSALIAIVPKFRQDWLIYQLTFISLIGQIFLCTWFYQGMQKMKFITILNIIVRVAFVILVFTMIKKPEDYILYPLFNSCSLMLGGLISIIFLKKYFKLKFIKTSLQDIWATVKYSSQFFLTKVGIALYRQSNAFVLGLVCTTVSVAYYVAADKIFWGILSLYFTFINALFPYMSKNKDITFFKKMLKYLVFVALLATVFIFVCSKYLIFGFFSSQYVESVKILQIFSLSFFFYVFVDTLGFPLLGAFGYVKETNMGYIYGGIYNLIGLLLLYFANIMNVYSVAILVSSAYVFMFLHRIYYVRKYELLK